QALASAAADGVRVWWLQSGEELAHSENNVKDAMAVAFPQKEEVANGTHREVGERTWSGKIPPKLWDMEEAAILRANAGIGTNWVAGSGFSAKSGRVALTVNQNGIGDQVTEGGVVCCETETGRVIRRWNVPASLQCVAISPDGHKVAAGDSQGGIRVWDI